MRKTSLLFFILFAWRLAAQPTASYDLITVNEGLSQGMVYSVLQGRDGYLWIATKDGLNRYDGYRFEVFAHDAFDPFSIAVNEIRGMYEAPRGWLLLIYEGGIDFFLPGTGRAFHLPISSQKGFDGYSNKESNVVTMLPDGSVWLAQNHKLWKFEVSKDILIKAEAAGQAYPDIKYASLEELAVDLPQDLQYKSVFWTKDQTLLTGASHGIFRIETNGPRYRLVPEAMQGMNVGIIGEDRAGRLWVYTGDELWAREHKGKPFEKILSGVSNYWKIDREGNLWNLQKAGLQKWNPDKLLHAGNPDYVASIPTGVEVSQALYFTAYHVDLTGNAWIGTSGYGMVKIKTAKPKFNSYLPKASMRKLHEDPSGNLFSTGGSRQFFSDRHFNFLGQNPWLVRFPQGHECLAIALDRQGHGWFKLLPEEIHRIDAATKEVTAYPLPGIGLISLKNGKLLSAEGDALYEFDPITQKSARHAYGRTVKLNSEYQFFGAMFYQGSGDEAWLFTMEGLLKISPAGTGYQFHLFQNDPANPASLSNNIVFSAAEDPLDPRRYLWVGTKGGGLNRLDLQSGEFKHYTTKQGLPDNVIYGILSDNAGHLWMSTNKGLCRFHVRNETVKNFTAADGLQDNEFNHSSFLKTRDGVMIFGGVNGMTTFHPDSLRFNEQKPRTAITRLWVNNENWDIGILGYSDFGQEAGNPLVSQYPNIPIPQYPNIKLSHLQNLITFEFAALEFTSPPQNLYRYQLLHHRLLSRDEGKSWVELGTRNSIQFANLQPGRYTFSVLGSNNDGTWSEQPFVLSFTIRPPWWATWWAYLLYALVMATALWFFYRFQLRRKFEYQETLRLRELDDFKNRFFTNITHEFRTPLTVILGMAEQLEPRVDEELRPKVGLIRRSGQNLLRLINQILDLAKLESDTLKLHYVQGDVLPYLRYIAESLHSLANAQNVMLRVESKETKIVMDYDPERLLQIVHNLLSNAIKFTPSGGRVTLFVGMRDEESGMKSGVTPSLIPHPSSLVLTVTDTGVSISPDDLPHIFDRFYQANNLEKAKAGGTGIGLALTKELVKAMNGDISVESRTSPSGDRGAGTTFTVRLPITKNAAKPNSGGDLKSPPELRSPSGGDFKSPPELGKQPDPSTPYVLLIEDNPDVVEYLAACLGGSGSGEPPYLLDFAYNGRAGIEKALETVPDLIVSDVMMPEKDGFEVCETLKNDERTSHVPIILLTAKADVQSRIAGLRRGADAYLSKPFHQEELLVTLANLLEVRKKLQSRYSKLVVGNWAPENPTLPLAPSQSLPLTADPEDAFVLKIKDITLERLSDAGFGVDDLCRTLAMSQPQLHRKLTALTGKNASQFIRFFRLARAKELLQNKTMNVNEVAFAVGFDDPKYFSRVFAEEFGVAPSKF